MIGDHLLEYALISGKLKLSACNIGIAGLISENEICILFVTYADIHILHKVLHNLLSLLGAPELLSEVKIAGYLYAVLLGCLKRLFGKDGCGIGNCGSDAGKVEPVRSFKDLIKIKISAGCGRDR